MGEGYTADPEQIRTHAKNVETLGKRFDAVNTASTHIAQDDEAYGLLCGWMSGVLEGRHQRQDELVAYVQENLTRVEKSLRDTAGDYAAMDSRVVDTMGSIEDRLS
jgi:excreted virulence factor EspC (type VII ESX diderm)